MFADNFGRDYQTETGWNVSVAHLLHQLDNEHASNVAAARRLMGMPPGQPTHASASYRHYLTPAGSSPAVEPYANAQPPWIFTPMFTHAGARATAGAVTW